MKQPKMGRPYTGAADVTHKARVSTDTDRAIRRDAERLGLPLADWWRRAAWLALDRRGEKQPLGFDLPGPDRR